MLIRCHSVSELESCDAGNARDGAIGDVKKTEAVGTRECDGDATRVGWRLGDKRKPGHAATRALELRTQLRNAQMDEE